MKNSNALVLGCLLVVLAGTAVVGGRQFHAAGEVRTFPDTAVFTATAGRPLFSQAFWAGQRPPVYPLFLKVCGDDPSSIARGQFLLSLVGWTVLAACCAHVLKHPLAKVLGFLMVQALALTPGIAMWHKVVLSESVSFSLLAACIGCWLLWAHRRSLPTAVAAVVTTALWVGVRDTNAYLALLAAAALVPALVYGAVRARAAGESPLRHPGLLAVCACLVLLFLGAASSSHHGRRWLAPLYNNVARRILPDEERTRWFADQGMPVTDALRERAGKWASSDGWAFYGDVRLEEFRAWSLSRGKSTYVRWLVTHPGYTYDEPMREFAAVFGADLAKYAPDGCLATAEDPRRPGGASTLPGAFLLGVLACLGWRELVRSDHGRGGLIVPLFLLASLIPCHLVVWHGDPMEIVRHSAQTVVQAKTALVLLVAWTADFALVRRRS